MRCALRSPAPWPAYGDWWSTMTTDRKLLEELRRALVPPAEPEADLRTALGTDDSGKVQRVAAKLERRLDQLDQGERRKLTGAAALLHRVHPTTSTTTPSASGVAAAPTTAVSSTSTTTVAAEGS